MSALTDWPESRFVEESFDSAAMATARSSFGVGLVVVSSCLRRGAGLHGAVTHVNGASVQLKRHAPASLHPPQSTIPDWES